MGAGKEDQSSSRQQDERALRLSCQSFQVLKLEHQVQIRSRDLGKN